MLAARDRAKAGERRTQMIVGSDTWETYWINWRMERAARWFTRVDEKRIPQNHEVFGWMDLLEAEFIKTDGTLGRANYLRRPSGNVMEAL